MKRREFLKGLSFVSAGLILSRLGTENSTGLAAQPSMKVLGNWEINGNLAKGILMIRIQGTDGGFGGFLQNQGESADSVNGKVEGPGDRSTPTTITFTRNRSGSFTQVYTGSVVYGPPLGPVGQREEMMAGDVHTQRRGTLSVVCHAHCRAVVSGCQF